MMTHVSCSETLHFAGQTAGNGDDTLRIAALRLLLSSGYPILRTLRCEVRDAVVLVRGVVPTYYLKQMAQALVQQLDGIQGIKNLVEVRVPESDWTEENPVRHVLVMTGKGADR